LLSVSVLLAGCARKQNDGSMAQRSSDVQLPPAPVTFELSVNGLPAEGMWKCDPILADFNGDGHVDLAAIPRVAYGPRVWLGDGRGNWTETEAGLRTREPSCGGGLCAVDVDEDGHLDLVVADHCNGVFVYLGNGRGEFEVVVEELYPEDMIPMDADLNTYLGAEDIDAGDIDRDGDIDLVVGASDDGGISVYLGDGTGSNWQRATAGLPVEGWCVRVQLYDIDEDGLLDIVAAHSSGPRVWLNTGDGAWEPAWDGLPSPSMHGLFTGLAVADVNADGRADLVVANWIDGPEVYLQQADLNWRKTDDVFPEMYGGAVGVDVGDVDRDGHADIVVSGRLKRDRGYVRGVFWLRGDGRGRWDFVRNSGLPISGLAAMSGVVIGDVNDDDVPDIAACSGLIVESVSAGSARSPEIPEHMLVWLGERRADELDD
jgi:hypothetical protein